MFGFFGALSCLVLGLASALSVVVRGRRARVVLAVAGLMLIYPGSLTDLIGTAITVVIFVLDLGMKKKASAAA